MNSNIKTLNCIKWRYNKDYQEDWENFGDKYDYQGLFEKENVSNENEFLREFLNIQEDSITLKYLLFKDSFGIKYKEYSYRGIIKLIQKQDKKFIFNYGKQLLFSMLFSINNNEDKIFKHFILNINLNRYKITKGSSKIESLKYKWSSVKEEINCLKYLGSKEPLPKSNNIKLAWLSFAEFQIDKIETCFLLGEYDTDRYAIFNGIDQSVKLLESISDILINKKFKHITFSHIQLDRSDSMNKWNKISAENFIKDPKIWKDSNFYKILQIILSKNSSINFITISKSTNVLVQLFEAVVNEICKSIKRPSILPLLKGGHMKVKFNFEKAIDLNEDEDLWYATEVYETDNPQKNK